MFSHIQNVQDPKYWEVCSPLSLHLSTSMNYLMTGYMDFYVLRCLDPLVFSPAFCFIVLTGTGGISK